MTNLVTKVKEDKEEFETEIWLDSDYKIAENSIKGDIRDLIVGTEKKTAMSWGGYYAGGYKKNEQIVLEISGKVAHYYDEFRNLLKKRIENVVEGSIKDYKKQLGKTNIEVYWAENDRIKIEIRPNSNGLKNVRKEFEKALINPKDPFGVPGKCPECKSKSDWKGYSGFGKWVRMICECGFSKTYYPLHKKK